MQRTAISDTGISSSVIGLGSWPLTGWLWGGMEEKDAKRIVLTALDEGIDLIDTAPVYGLGAAEKILGDALKGKRHQVVLVSKCGLSWEDTQGTLFASFDSQDVYLCQRPEAIRRDLEASLKRLQTDYIDIYMPHWPDAQTPLEETLGTLEALKREGKIRAIGGSNIEHGKLDDYTPQTQCAQLLYSLLDRHIDSGFLDHCRAANVDVMAHSVLAQGLLSGRIATDRTFAEDDLRAESPRFSQENRQKMLAFSEALQPLANSLETDTGSLAIAWALHQKGIGRVLCGARSEAQAKWNAKAGALTLDQSQLDTIEEHFNQFDIQ